MVHRALAVAPDSVEFEDLSDIFGSFFGGGFGGGSRRASNGPRKGNDRFMQMRIDFMDAIFGKTETITIDVDEQCDECMAAVHAVNLM